MTATSTPTAYSDTFDYDIYGRLSLKGGSNYSYDPQHPHAVHSALGWVYTYNQSGDVVSKTDGTDTYTFTYSSELKVETVSLNGQELHHLLMMRTEPGFPSGVPLQHPSQATDP